MKFYKIEESELRELLRMQYLKSCSDPDLIFYADEEVDEIIKDYPEV